MHNVVSLFSGCGGFDLGFKQAGFEVIYACDSDPAAVECYHRNLDAAIELADVTSPAFKTTIKAIGTCDVVLGGFPCQGFSKAGPKRADDERNVLYKEMLHAVETLKPKVFIAENVDGISQNFQGAFLHKIVKDFGQLGYHVEYRILDAVAFGIPQHRRRIFFVGTESSIEGRFVWPEPTHSAKPRNGESSLSNIPLFDVCLEGMQPTTQSLPLPPVRTIADAISDLLDLNDHVPDHLVTGAWPEKYSHVIRAIGPGQKLCNVRHAPTSVYTWEIPEVFGTVTDRQKLILETISRQRRLKRYGTILNGNPLPQDEIQRLTGLIEVADDLSELLSKGYLKLIDAKYDLKGAMFCSGLFKRPGWREPSPTVLTNFHNPRYFLHPIKDRPFSLRECTRLQGFPDSFTFGSERSTANLVDGYRLIGNAVPPPLGKILALATLQLLGRESVSGLSINV